MMYLIEHIQKYEYELDEPLFVEDKLDEILRFELQLLIDDKCELLEVDVQLEAVLAEVDECDDDEVVEVELVEPEQLEVTNIEEIDELDFVDMVDEVDEVEVVTPEPLVTDEELDDYEIEFAEMLQLIVVEVEDELDTVTLILDTEENDETELCLYVIKQTEAAEYEQLCDEMSVMYAIDTVYINLYVVEHSQLQHNFL